MSLQKLMVRRWSDWYARRSGGTPSSRKLRKGIPSRLSGLCIVTQLQSQPCALLRPDGRRTLRFLRPSR